MRRIHVFWVGAALFGLAIGLPLAWGLSHFHRSSEAHEQQSARRNGEISRTGKEAVSPPRDGAQFTRQKHQDHDWGSPEAWLVYLTAALAAFTAMLYKSTRDIAIDARTNSAKALSASTIATDLARDEFNAAHRPRIGIRGVHTATINGSEHLYFRYVNRGIGTAKVIQIGCAIVIAEAIRKEPNFTPTEEGGVELKSGDSRPYEYTPADFAEFAFGRAYADTATPRSTSSTAYFIGFITYEDSMRRQRQTGFCRKNTLGSDIWETVEGSVYEYED